MTDHTNNQILLDATSRNWRRRLGALPWAVLEELALAARQTGQGWTAPIGVRGIAATLGITKDTAARAISALHSAELVTAVRISARDGRSRTGYALNLPPGVSVLWCPANRDSTASGDDVCPNGEYGPCPDGEYRARPSGRHRDHPDRDAVDPLHPGLFPPFEGASP
jgi:hypothetical protein